MSDAAVAATTSNPPVTAANAADRDQLRSIVNEAAALLPAQGPLTAFVFINTLQGMEDIPFAEGLHQGAELFHSEPYLTENQYRERLLHGRIRVDDLRAEIREHLGADVDGPIVPTGTRFDLWLAMLQFPFQWVDANELEWYLEDTSALVKLRPEVAEAVRDQWLFESRHWIMRDLRTSERPSGSESTTNIRSVLDDFDESSIEKWPPATWESFCLHVLWRICRDGVSRVTAQVANTSPYRVRRHRDLLLREFSLDPDVRVDDLLIRFCAAYADQGLAHWVLPRRELGFYRAFLELFSDTEPHADTWQIRVAAAVREYRNKQADPLTCLHESLTQLGLAPAEWRDYLRETMLVLRGWAGALWQMETRPDRVPIGAPEGTLVEFLAIRVLLDRLAAELVLEEGVAAADTVQPLLPLTTWYRDSLTAPRGTGRERAVEQTLLIFQLAQVMGWSLEVLHKLRPEQWQSLVEEIERCSSLQRRKTFHQAFERRLRIQALDAVSAQSSHTGPTVAVPSFQAVFCIDAREESFRRHLEEQDPQCQTFGAAGFFAVAMYYRGITDAHFSALCPIVLRPKNWVVEDILAPAAQTHRSRIRWRRALGAASHQIHLDSRTLVGGMMLSAGLGALASIPLVARVLFPTMTAHFRRMLNSLVDPPPLTRLRLERQADQPPGPLEGQIGFTLEEMTNICERLLRDIGLIRNFSRIVMFLGHGTFCMNNPHSSSYDCGACSGRAGGPNARALAAMLNDPRVRSNLFRRGLEIPIDTVFLGGLHNTADDTITFADLDLLPQSHFSDFERVKRTLDETCRRNAHERCRRFYSAPLDITPVEAHAHVKGRSEDLAQVRPEYGNASNAICFVGRRHRIRGLYLDRRSFMHSYDPLQDDAEGTILARILGAVVPVCSGINLQYFFSAIDAKGWGAGTKLPHNVTSLLGVMDGAASDLRSGLPAQGTEIHEPVRLLFVIESTPECLQGIMARNPVVGRILQNGWSQLAVLDPHSPNLQLFRAGKFESYSPETGEIPHAATSVEWYRGWRDHLKFARIG